MSVSVNIHVRRSGEVKCGTDHMSGWIQVRDGDGSDVTILLPFNVPPEKVRAIAAAIEAALEPIKVEVAA